MPKFLSVALLAASSALVVTCSTALPAALQQSTPPRIREIPIQPTPINSGQQMYGTYCAVCHGREGTGMGPAAPALKTTPPDLTLLSKKNGGKFPADRVTTVLRFGVQTPAHGTSEMPIWGDLMQSLHPESTGGMLIQMRIKNITDYLRQIQQ